VTNYDLSLLSIYLIQTTMKKNDNLLAKIKHIFSNENFLHSIHFTENLVSKILSIALVIVIFVSLFDLVFILVKDLFTTHPIGFFNKTLIEIFGLFLNILIALELLENITAYLKKHIVQVELVVVTAIIAIARKIIIFNPKEYDKMDLIALTIGCLALSVSYWLIRKLNQDKNN
jgi:uncharacterized membrane protein (DUF373 family)